MRFMDTVRETGGETAIDALDETLGTLVSPVRTGRGPQAFAAISAAPMPAAPIPAAPIPAAPIPAAPILTREHIPCTNLIGANLADAKLASAHPCDRTAAGHSLAKSAAKGAVKGGHSAHRPACHIKHLKHIEPAGRLDPCGHLPAWLKDLPLASLLPLSPLSQAGDGDAADAERAYYRTGPWSTIEP